MVIEVIGNIFRELKTRRISKIRKKMRKLKLTENLRLKAKVIFSIQ